MSHRRPVELVRTCIVTAAILLARPLPVLAEGAPAGEPATGADQAKGIVGAPPIPTGGYGGPTPPLGAPVPRPKGLSGEVSGAVLFERINEDYFVTLDLMNELSIGPVTFGVWVPLRFRVWDRAPKTSDILRREDWDEVSDYARLLRFVEVNLGYERWRFRGRFGALDGESLGHGTIVAGYFNSLDRNHYQAGLVLNAAIRFGGIEFMLDNLLGPEVYGVRAHVRPLSFFSKNVWASRLVTALTVAGDGRAPVGLADTNPADKRPDLDDQTNFRLSGTTPVTAFGWDTEYTLVQNRLIDLVPYLDVNFLFDGGTGAGMHLGTFFNLRIPTPVGPTLLTRLEYRAIGKGYAPRYIDSLYEVQRLQYAPGVYRDAAGLPLTKLGWLRLGDSGRHGWLGELYFDFAGWVRVGGTYEDYTGPNNAALTLSLLLPKIPLVKLGAYFMRRGFDGLGDAFSLDGALLVAYAKVKVWGPIFLSASYGRSWHVQEDGSYRTEDNFGAGAGVAFSY